MLRLWSCFKLSLLIYPKKNTGFRLCPALARTSITLGTEFLQSMNSKMELQSEKTNQGGLCMSDTYLLHLAPRPAVVVSISRNLALKPASDIGSHERGMRLMHKSLIFLTPMQPMLSEKLRRLCFQCSHSTNNDELEQVVILVLPQRIRGATQGEEAAQAFHKKLQIKKKTENADIFQRNWLGSMSVLGCSGEKL